MARGPPRPPAGSRGRSKSNDYENTFTATDGALFSSPFRKYFLSFFFFFFFEKSQNHVLFFMRGKIWKTEQVCQNQNVWKACNCFSFVVCISHILHEPKQTDKSYLLNKLHKFVISYTYNGCQCDSVMSEYPQDDGSVCCCYDYWVKKAIEAEFILEH